MKKTELELLALKNSFPQGVDGALLEMVVENFDDKAAYAQFVKQYTVEVWDRKSEINGVSAKEILANREDVTDEGVIVLLKDGDQVLFFQPHDPDESGFASMDKARALEVGSKLRDDKVDQSIDTALRQEILEKAVK